MALTTVDDRGLSKPIDLLDDEKIRFGTGNDLEIYHVGDSNYIKTMNGDINFRYSGQNMIIAKPGGSVELYHNNSKKFETKAAGVEITGQLINFTSGTAIALGDSSEAKFGSDADLSIYHDGSHAYITNTTGELVIRDDSRLRIRTDELVINSGDNGESIIYAAKDGAVQLYHNNFKSFETYNRGITVYGPEGDHGEVYIYADEGDDNADKYLLQSNTDGFFYIKNFTDGSWEKNIRTSGGGSTGLYYDNSKKFETNSTGILVGGDVDNSTSTQGVAVFTNGYIRSRVADTSATAFVVSVENSGASKALITGAGNGYFTGGLDVPDDAKIQAGDGDDLQIFHDGNNSKIVNTTGNLTINASAGEAGVDIIPDGAVELYYNAVKKLNTESNGVTISGNLYMPDSEVIKLGTGHDLLLYHDGSKSYIVNGEGNLELQNGARSIDFKSNSFTVKNGADDEWIITGTNGSGVELYYDNSKKFETTSDGPAISSQGADESRLRFLTSSHTTTRIGYYGLSNKFGMDVNGGFEIRDAGNSYETMFRASPNGSTELYYDGTKKLYTNSSGIRGDDDVEIQLGSGGDFIFRHNGANSFIESYTGNLLLRPKLNEEGIVIRQDGEVELYHNNIQKLETTTSGITVTGSVSTNDINLSNIDAEPNEVDGTRGSWTIQEGSDDLFLINRSNGKKYKFNLTEVS